MVNCASDTEFLAKLFCIRKAFDLILQDKTYQNWFIESGKEIVGDIMWHGDRVSTEMLMSRVVIQSTVADPVEK